ncbi:putative manganese-dependent inorganic diphosphatase [Coprococcus sp. AF21-14LB]|uniref:putative manganese-dependent inorganic diphosphatase n=1 Tax=Coprococcus sp. AF21-14LB TaxID=2292231 RepID=UPI000E54F282|nr:putative manganese-dependent inorganic diphosphatase [Coprococcus sp. AF21-14LB]RGS79192.1 putative manganese-dependent inorganic diphosphatase [Coprococcus sp. AF21-14LB]
MEMNKTGKVYVVGHKNPDTDSICSAIAYANLKRILTGEEYVAKRAGEISEETSYVLKKFQVEAPPLLTNVNLQVKDMDIHRVQGVPGNLSIKEVWKMMKEDNMKSMPITRDEHLEGMITIGDIATSYMDVYDNRILANARTQYRNINHTLDGEMITGNEHGYFVKGKVVIAAASPDLMENFIEKDDLVIVGNRYETQLCAIEMDASCLVVTQGSKVSKTIRKMAEEREIVIISTPHDTFTAARLINQSIPVKYFMTKDNIVGFRTNEMLDEVKEVMTKKKYRDFPVTDKKGRFVGFISRRRLMTARKKRVILVDHNEKTQAVDGIEEADILEIIDHHRLGNLETIGPVFFRNQPVGCTATIIYQMYQENGVEIDPTTAALLCSAIISDTLMFRSPTCTPLDKMTAELLARIADINIEEHAMNMFDAGSNLKGKTAEEICFMDFKQFAVNQMTFGVGQINSMNQEELDVIKEKVSGCLEALREKHGLDMIYFMLTNIIEESTELLCCGHGAKAIVIGAFDLSEDEEKALLKGVVSRKKQLVPALMSQIQQ